MANHKNTKCKDPYDADEALPPGFNTMVTAQTLSCCSRFKKIINFMSQRHHLFFIQRNRETLNGETHTPQSAERKQGTCPQSLDETFLGCGVRVTNVSMHYIQVYSIVT